MQALGSLSQPTCSSTALRAASNDKKAARFNDIRVGQAREALGGARRKRASRAAPTPPSLPTSDRFARLFNDVCQVQGVGLREASASPRYSSPPHGRHQRLILLSTADKMFARLVGDAARFRGVGLQGSLSQRSAPHRLAGLQRLVPLLLPKRFARLLTTQPGQGV